MCSMLFVNMVPSHVTLTRFSSGKMRERMMPSAAGRICGFRRTQTQQFPFSGSGGEIGQRRFLADIGNCRVDGQQGSKAYPQAVLSVL